MDPITLSMLISGGATALGGINSYMSNQQNQQLAMLEYYMQLQQQQQQIVEAQRQQREAKLGSTDAAGNRTHFVPGRGWVTELSDQQEQIQNLTEEEQLRQLIEGSGRAERVDARANAMRNDEAQMADAAMQQYKRAERPIESDIYNLIMQSGTQARAEAADAAGEATARQALRGGGGFDAAELMAKARGQSDQRAAQAQGIQARLQAGQIADQQFSGDRDKAMGLYDYFRRASTSGTQAPNGYMPQGPQARSTGNADQQLLAAFGGGPTEMTGFTANNALYDTANDLASMYGLYNMYNKGTAEDKQRKDAFGKNVGSL